MKNITPDYITTCGNKHANVARITTEEIETIVAVLPGCEIIGSVAYRSGVAIDNVNGITNAAEDMGIEAAKAVYAKIAAKAVKIYKADQSPA
jgi:hypothetical protein